VVLKGLNNRTVILNISSKRRSNYYG